MVRSPFELSLADIISGIDKPAYTKEEVSNAQTEANRRRYAEERDLVERKRKREADVTNHLKIARVKFQKHQERQGSPDVAHEEQSVLGSSIRLKSKINAPYVTVDTMLLDDEETVQVEDTELVATRIGIEEIIETNVDLDELDVACDYVASVGRVSPYRKEVYRINPKSGTRGEFVRSIPNFDVLSFRTFSGLPRELWRVVHSQSAGAVTTSQLGAHFYSQARKMHGASSKFDNFEMKDIADQLKRHANGEKKNFCSHWISTTDSLEHALAKADQYSCAKKGDSVMIYRIDTRTLKMPALVLSMYGAIKAYGIEDRLLGWRWKMLKYGTFTEWIVWDELDAEDVERIPYEELVRPAHPKPTLSGTCVSKRGPNLREIVPELGRIASKEIRTRRVRGIPRTALHKKCYYSTQQEAEMQAFDEKTYVKRLGRLPKAPKIVQDDKRSNISTHRLDGIHTIAGSWRSKILIFIWILSLLTKKHYVDDMVEAIVDRYPSVIAMSLDVIDNNDSTKHRTTRKVLKFDIPGPCYSTRVDINSYYGLMKACIKRWCQVVQKHHDEYNGLDVYFMYEEHQTKRRLKLLQEQGLLGRCQAVDLLPVHTTQVATAKHPDLSEIRAVGELVGYVESDEAYKARRAAQYGIGTKVLAPDVRVRQLGLDLRKLDGRRAKMKIDEMMASTPTLRMQQGLTESVT